MPQDIRKTFRPLILTGGGQAHLVALRYWVERGWRAPPGSVLISPDTRAWYSGMMPGLIAGRFSQSDCAVAMAGLCEETGFELCVDQVQALNAATQTLQLVSGRALRYEWLSVNTGSVPLTVKHSDGSVPQVAAKPFPEFIRHLEQWQFGPSIAGIAVVGGGAAAFELALALRKALSSEPVILLSGQELLASHNAGVRRRARRFLAAANVQLYENRPVTHIREGYLRHGGQLLCHAGAVVLATGAGALPWYKQSGLPTDENGFIRVSTTLQSVGHNNVFASGDSASLIGSQRSGVYSVRHGSVLASNIPALLNHKPLTDYRPQKQALALLATADGGALMSYGRFSAQGRLAGIWKDYLDLSFMKRHRR